MRILVIDDDPLIRKLLKEGLELAYYAVDVAADGKQGCYLACTSDYDVVILDNRMPGKQGIDVCREIRESGKTMPIIILSVISDVDVKTELLDTCADDYMTKASFSLKELQAHIRAVLRRPHPLKGEVITVDDLTLDSLKYTVYRGKRKISLTRKEFMLLNYLMRNHGMTITRGQILEHVWDGEADSTSNTVETLVKRLRQKIDRNAKKPLIHTVYGTGYKLDVAD